MNNSSQKFSFVLPLRKGSERVKNKNTKPFGKYKMGLAQLKVEQLLEVNEPEEIIVTTDDDVFLEFLSKNYSDNRLILDKRPDTLCASSTPVSELISYIKNLVQGVQHIYWVHATSPFVSAMDYTDAWKIYLQNIKNQSHDSLMSVTEIKQFLWSKEQNRVINNENHHERWPRTQDLTPLYEINHAFYINAVSNYSDRIGQNPYCYCLDKIRSLDIDEASDFELAQKLAALDIKL